MTEGQMQVFSLRLKREQRRRLDELATETDRNAGQVMRALLDAATVGTVPELRLDREALGLDQRDGADLRRGRDGDPRQEAAT